MPKQINVVKVFAPATVANVGVGYDILGFALNGPGDEIIARWSDEPGLHIDRIYGTDKNLPLDVNKNTATLGAVKLLKDLGKEDLGISLTIYKKMPFGSGMGSSAASAAAGILAINELLGKPLTKRELAPYAVLGESAADGAIHGDNVLPSLLGGMILIRDNNNLDFVRLPAPTGVYAFVIYPNIEILTKDARAVLSTEVPLSDVIKQTGNIAAFVSSLYTMNMDLMKRSLKDHIIEHQRAQLIPHFYDLQQIAMENNALNYTISGAGPSMFGFAENSLIANNITEKLLDYLAQKNISCNQYISPINTVGAYKF